MNHPDFKIPSGGDKIQSHQGKLRIPDHPIIPVLIGDGIGPDIWQAAQPVLDAAVFIAYNSQRRLHWLEFPSNTLAQVQSLASMIETFANYHVGLKGPLSTAVGHGARSLNVTLRRELDLYIGMRPVQWIPGCPSPVLHPEHVNMVVFRENTEDIYSGIEFEAGTSANTNFLAWLEITYPEQFEKIRFPKSSGISIKPISSEGSTRLVRAAINYALKNQRNRLTLVHKGNIMKYTEGAFVKWAYDFAESEFGSQVFTLRQWEKMKSTSGETDANQTHMEAISQDKLFINDVIADAALEQTLTRPKEFDIIATTNLNGDYLSDALSAQVGGLGIAPGANLNDIDNIAIFEAIHGTAPSLAGKNVANPSSLILSGAMLLEHISWQEAADLVRWGIQAALAEKIVTADFYRLMPDATLTSTTDFGHAIIRTMHQAQKGDKGI
jgi:isocitrate dehydrogenase